MEISKKKPFSYIRLELWVSEKKLQQREGAYTKTNQHEQSWNEEDLMVTGRGGDRCGCEALALYYRHLGLCHCKEQHSLGSMSKEPNSPEGGVSSQGHCFPWPNII